jgi:hypothetical protein
MLTLREVSTRGIERGWEAALQWYFPEPIAAFVSKLNARHIFE